MNRYEALAEDIASAIQAGVLRPGDRLPSVRHSALTRKLSLSTVFQAYYLLEARGLVRARERSGYFVLERPRALPPRVRAVPVPPDASAPVDISDAVFGMLRAATMPDVVPLGSPFPDPALFPLAELGRSMAASARGFRSHDVLDDLSPGKEALRRLIAQRYMARGANVHHDEIVITNGALEALNLCLSTVAKAGDCVIVESPAFYGALQAIEHLGMRAVEVATDPETGIDLDRLEHALRRHQPKACWLMPTFHNPLGATMPDENKRALVQLLARFGVPLIEDDVYAELHFGSVAPRPAKAWDTEGLVLHCSSFSKSLAPGYRIGWAAAGRHVKQVARQKLATTLMSSMPAQLGLVDYLQRGGIDRHLRRLRHALAGRYADVAAAVFRHFPEGTCATQPQGGYFMWLHMPDGVDSMAMLQHAISHKICIAPGPVFSGSGGYLSSLRLNFSHGLTERTDDALALLGAYAAASARRPVPHAA